MHNRRHSLQIILRTNLDGSMESDDMRIRVAPVYCDDPAGHNEGGEMKFLWTCSLQTPVGVKISMVE